MIEPWEIGLAGLGLLAIEGSASATPVTSSSTPASTDQGYPTDPEIEALGLAGDMHTGPKGAAYLLRQHFGKAVVFTSGKRDLPSQCHAMAKDLVQSHSRKWIQATYKKSAGGALVSPVAKAMQAWVDQHPEAKTVDSLAAGLLSVGRQFNSDQLGTLSKHLCTPSLAFDVQPNGNASILAAMQKLPGLVLDHEGGLVRWHYQTTANAVMPAEGLV